MKERSTTPDLDRLKAEVVTAAQTPARWPAINQLAWALRFDYPEEAIHWAQVVLDECRQVSAQVPALTVGLAWRTLAESRLRLDDLSGAASALEHAYGYLKQHCEQSTECPSDCQQALGECLNTRAKIAHFEGRLSEALKTFHEVQRLYQQIDYRFGLAGISNNLGQAYQQVGNHDRAIKHYQDAIPLLDEVGEKRALLRVYANLASVYHELGDPHSARRYVDLALNQPAMEQAEVSLRVDLHLLKARLELNHSQLEAAATETELALHLAEELGRRRIIRDCCHLLAQIHWTRHQPEMALPVALRGLELAQDRQNLRGHAESLFQIGQMLLAENQRPWKTLYAQLQKLDPSWVPAGDRPPLTALPLGLHCLETAVQLAEDDADWPERPRLLRELAEAYAQQSRLPEAYHTLAKANTVYTQQTDLTLKRKIERRQLAFEMEMAQQQAENERQRNEELASANQRLRQLMAEKDDFLSIVSHDLRNPLTNIQAISAIIKDNLQQAAACPESLELLELVESSAEEMSQLIEEILDLRQMERGTFKAEPEAFRADELFLSVMRDFTSQAERKQITFLPEVAPEVTAYADRRQIQRILSNLISNAIKFSPTQRRIWLKLSTAEPLGEDAHLAFQVRDEGPSIPANELERLFQRFARLSPQPTGDEPSTGLGLAIVKQLAELNGGSVACHSVVGEGSTFTLRVPLAPVKATEAHAAVSACCQDAS